MRKDLKMALAALSREKSYHGQWVIRTHFNTERLLRELESMGLARSSTGRNRFGIYNQFFPLTPADAGHPDNVIL